MADLELTCLECGKTLSVSEFVDDRALVCRSCGARLERPAGGSAQKPKAQRKLSATGRPREDAAEAEQEEKAEADRVWTGKKELSKKDMKARVVHHRYALALFIVLGGLMAYLRYGGGLPPDMLAREREYAMYGLLGLHVAIILKAFEDNVFQGILCLLIPFYSVYYIAAESDSLYLKAIIGAVAIGIGQDGAAALQVEFFEMCKSVNDWIGSGGGPV